MFVSILLLCATHAFAAGKWTDADLLLRSGKYEDALAACEKALGEGTMDIEEWQHIRVRALLTLGRNADALAAVNAALFTEDNSIRLRWLAREAAFANGKVELAQEHLLEIRKLISGRGWAYRDAPNLVVFGKVALLLGVDAKEVLDKIFAVAQRADADNRDVYLARGQLALDKQDYALAAKAFEEGLKRIPGDADLLFGLASARAEGDRRAMIEALDGAMKANPRHIPALLLQARHRIEAEEFRDAESLLAEVRDINPSQPEAWAYLAAIAHLRNLPDAEASARAEALKAWSTNPRVDHIIGRTISRAYRFSEGAAYQRRALAADPSFQPAKAQLAVDLLRLGEVDEGWQLVQDVHAADGYNVEAFNLATLRDTMAGYATLTTPDFIVRMDSREARLYGPRVLAVLTRAKEQLVPRYGVQLAAPTTVEIFADPKDFAVRTFGLPDIPGFLGVCFGRVVTANSPAATGGNAVNWEAVLWHEFCHVVTLQLTKNKMPRWLSEGISVYEERRANPAWGQHMNPRYREMILNRETLTPVSQLSSAFLAPRSPQHLQFAYYQSSLVVEFIVERFGFPALKAILDDLGAGVPINQAIAAHTAPMPALELQFATYARELADKLAPGLDWEKPPAAVLDAGGEEFAAWAQKNENNYWALTFRARQLADEKKWKDAQVVLNRLIALHPTQTGPDSAYRLLAESHRALGETADERAVLVRLTAIDAEAADANLRLMELAAADPTPAGRIEARVAAERFLAINPLVPPPWRTLAETSEALGDAPTAIQAWRTFVQLDPPNPAAAHFRLARLLHGARDPAARREVLQALEEAPRYRDALALLLEINRSTPAAPAAVPDTAPKPVIAVPTFTPGPPRIP